MITVQETTAGNYYPNHKYILSDDRRKMFGYVKAGDKYPQLFAKPMSFDARRRTFRVIVRTADVRPEVMTTLIKGSKGDVYTVTNDNGRYACTCPIALYRRQTCKHITQVINDTKSNPVKG